MSSLFTAVSLPWTVIGRTDAALTVAVVFTADILITTQGTAAFDAI